MNKTIFAVFWVASLGGCTTTGDVSTLKPAWADNPPAGLYSACVNKTEKNTYYKKVALAKAIAKQTEEDSAKVSSSKKMLKSSGKKTTYTSEITQESKGTYKAFNIHEEFDGGYNYCVLISITSL